MYIWPCDIKKVDPSIQKCGENVWGTLKVVGILLDLLGPKRDLNQNTERGFLTTAIQMCGSSEREICFVSFWGDRGTEPLSKCVGFFFPQIWPFKHLE